MRAGTISRICSRASDSCACLHKRKVAKPLPVGKFQASSNSQASSSTVSSACQPEKAKYVTRRRARGGEQINSKRGDPPRWKSWQVRVDDKGPVLSRCTSVR